MAFLQHHSEIDGVLGARAKGVRPSEVILPDSLDLGVLGIALHACPPKGTLGSHELILPCNDGTFPVVQLPFSVEELLL
jgi:hypothetical protein